MKKTRNFTAILMAIMAAFCCVFVVSCSKDFPPTVGLTPLQLIEKTKYGVVLVHDGFLEGSGIVVESSKDGSVIVTNYHVVATAISQNASVNIKFLGEDFVEATILGHCKDYDIAVLKTNFAPTNPYVFSLNSYETSSAIDNENKNGSSGVNYNRDANTIKTPALGESVLALGYVQSQLCVYDGIISCATKLAKVTHQDEEAHLYLTETTAFAPFGTSGGACIDADGNLVGLNAFSHTQNGAMSGISYKIPSKIVAAVVKRITQTNDYPFPLATGFSINSDGSIALIYLGGLVVRSEENALIVQDSSLPSYPVGSVIAKVNGKTIDPITFISEVILTAQNTTITLK